MPVEGEYLGMQFVVPDNDHENLAYFAHCAAHDFHLQACEACDLLRYPPTTGCPHCGAAGGRWRALAEGGAVEGEVHSLTVVHHAIQPGLRAHVPYAVLLVELDAGRGRPTEHDGVRVVGNLVTPDGALAPPDLVARVGIGTRVRMAYTDVAPGLSLPQWTLAEAVP